MDKEKAVFFFPTLKFKWGGAYFEESQLKFQSWTFASMANAVLLKEKAAAFSSSLKNFKTRSYSQSPFPTVTFYRQLLWLDRGTVGTKFSQKKFQLRDKPLKILNVKWVRFRECEKKCKARSLTWILLDLGLFCAFSSQWKPIVSKKAEYICYWCHFLLGLRPFQISSTW